jgi:hypothetical protein
MENYLTMWSIFLAVASTTLAIAAFIFSWASYRNATKMQIKAQEILSQISQKVEVVVERTTHQIDKAWDYFTGLPSASLSKAHEELSIKEEELKNQIIEEARKETAQLMEGTGLQKDLLNELIDKVQSLVDKSSERTKQLLQRETILTNLSKIENDIRDFATVKGLKCPKQMGLNDIANLRDSSKFEFIGQFVFDLLQELIIFRDERPEKFTEKQNTILLDQSIALLDYLSQWRRKICKDKG